MNKSVSKAGFGILELLLVIVTVVVIGAIGWMTYRGLTTKTTSAATASTKSSAASSQSTDPYAGWITYTSKVEKITFKYPTDWAVDTKDALHPNDPNNTDYIALKSPDGKVVIHWTSEVDGFGDEHGDSYPYNEVVNKVVIPGAANHYVVSGITTLDGTVYYPWMAAEDNVQLTKFSQGVSGNVAFFMGINNINPTTSSPAGVLFSTSGFRTNQGLPGLSKADATAYFSSPDMQQAKLILLSLRY